MADELPVLITVTGTDNMGGETTLSTLGALSELGEGWCLHYEETSPDSMDTIQTLVAYRPNSVSIFRTGGIMSTIEYTENETFVSKYDTEMGSFILRIFSNEVRVRRRGNSGSIRLVYQVSLSSSLSSSGETAMRWLEIQFTPCGK